jgi:ribosome-associated heat shock protein Hsp15
VRIAGERIKPAREARIGEALEIAIGEQRLEVVVRALSAVRGPALAARQLYVETEESVRRREQRAEARRLGAEPAQAIRGRPTKREGRALRRVRNGP